MSDLAAVASSPEVATSATSGATPGATSEVDLGWALRTLLRSYLRQVGEAVADVPGGPRAYQVMTVAADNTCQNQAAMADILGLDRTLMTYLVDGLENDGLVVRTPDPADRRARRVTLTEKGDDLMAGLRSRVDDVEKRLLAGLPADSAARLRHDLGRAAQSAPADSAPGEPSPCTEDSCTV
jgi:MarR family transcriptional regulator for hemolysin